MAAPFPNYKIPAGLRVMKSGMSHVIHPSDDGTYRFMDLGTGNTQVLSYREALHYLRLPGVSAANMQNTTSAAAARIRDGGFHYRDQLRPSIQSQIDPRVAFCMGIDALVDRGFRIYPAMLDKLEIRKLIRKVAAEHFKVKPIIVLGTELRGGSEKTVIPLPCGRTLFKYWHRFRDSGYDEMSLPDQAWKRGNRERRIVLRVVELMSQALDEAWLDTRKPTIVYALKHLHGLISDENEKRSRNGLGPLPSVSHKTLAEHSKKVSETARQIARDGLRAVENNRSRGATDTRALFIGELVQVDECKLSIITVAKRCGWWENLTAEEKQTLEEIDEIIRSRLWLILILDVASRMPLGWVLTGSPGKDAMLEAIRMAMLDKTREKILYGCECDPMPAVGIACFLYDNGAPGRNADVKSANLGLDVQTVDARAYHGVEKPYIERMFGSLESRVINMLHGYTGRKAGHLTGYDAIENGVLDVQELYGIITRYLVDEYPYERHYGATMMGARPIKKVEEINRDYGFIPAPPDHDRRIHLGWRIVVTATDDGVKAFGLPYNSPELQALKDSIHGKVAVYTDPDCIDHVSIVIEGHPEPVLAELSWTAMKGLTLHEFQEVALAARAEDPDETEIFEARLIRVRRERYEQMQFIATERNLGRTFITAREAEAKAAVIATGVQTARVGDIDNTARAGSVANQTPGSGVRKVGKGFQAALDGNVVGKGGRPAGDGQIRLGKPDTKGKLS